MTPNISFHRVQTVDLGPVRMFLGKETSPKFWTRTVTFWDESKQPFAVQLFSFSEDGLLIGEERKKPDPVVVEPPPY